MPIEKRDQQSADCFWMPDEKHLEGQEDAHWPLLKVILIASVIGWVLVIAGIIRWILS